MNIKESFNRFKSWQYAPLATLVSIIFLITLGLNVAVWAKNRPVQSEEPTVTPTPEIIPTLEPTDLPEPSETPTKAPTKKPTPKPTVVIPTSTPKPASPTSTPGPTNTPAPSATPTSGPDTTAPTIQSMSGPEHNGSYSITTMTTYCFPMYLTDNVTKDSTKFQVSHQHDSTTWSDWNNNISPCFSPTIGPHTFSIKVKDEAGNESTTITRTFTITP